MKKILMLILAMAILPQPAKASGLSACSALGDESAYGEKFDDYALLLEGKEGYIFRTGKDLRMDFDISDEHLAFYKKFSEALKEKGTELVLAIPPVRGVTAKSLLPDDSPLTRNFDPALATKNYAAFIDRMNQAGVHVAGTPQIRAGAKYYYKADQHWTTAGAQEMAEAVANLAKNLSVYESVRKSEFVTSPLKDVAFDGRFTLAIDALCGASIPEEKDSLTQTLPVEKDQGKNSLFGAPPKPDIVLVGTSYSKREENDMNFEGALKQSLSADVYNAAIAGGGFGDSIIYYLNSGDYRKHPPKILIWEIPSYYDLNGDSSIKTVLQAIPAVYGDCKRPIKESSVKLNDENVILLDGLADKKVVASHTYAYLNFKQPVKNDFTIDYLNADKSEESLEFQRSNRYPHDGIYYFTPKDESNALAQTISLRSPDDMRGMTVKAKLCKLP